MQDSKLNTKQQEAVEYTEGPLLVVAGAGAGKTRVITHRIAHLIDKGARPELVLAVTFTNKAAGEMRSRVLDLISNTKNQTTSDKEGESYVTGQMSNVTNGAPFVSTFHSLGVYILRQSGKALNISRWFAIYDRSDSISAIKRVMKEKSYDPKQFEPKGILNVISKNKGNFVSLEEFREEASGNYYFDIVVDVWEGYAAILEKEKALDFDDLLVKTVELLKKYPDILKRYQSQWEYLHVDEYQDTNRVQYELVRLLAGEKKNICVVGDQDQMIYSWRGASTRNMEDFEKDFPNTHIVMLEENYRSTPTILTAANEVIKKNDDRKDKNLFTSRPDGEKILVYEAFDGMDEGRFVVKQASFLANAGEALEEIAVLYRANFQSRVLEEMFLEAGVPYTVLGTRFFERREVRDILAYVKAAMNPEDRASVTRVINTPRRGLGAKTLEKVFAGQTSELPAKTREKVQSFYKTLEQFEEILSTKKPSESLRAIVMRSGYEEMLKSGNEDEQERLENIRELVSLSQKYDVLVPEEGIEKLLTDSSLADDQDTLAQEESKKRGVRLMTVHAAKGLEFNHIFVVGLEQDLFPHTKMDDGLTPERLEEERRLFYVALTRARKRLYLSHAGLRYIYGSQVINMPSEFLDDIPGELIESQQSTYQPRNQYGSNRWSNNEENQDWKPPSFNQEPYDPDDGFLGNIID